MMDTSASLPLDVILYIARYHLELATLKSFALLNRTIYTFSTQRLWHSVTIRPDPDFPQSPDYLNSAVLFIIRSDVRLRVRNVAIVGLKDSFASHFSPLMRALQEVPKLESLRIEGGWPRNQIQDIVNTTTLSSTLRSFETGLQDVSRFCLQHPSLEHLGLHSQMYSIAAPLANLKSIKVHGISQCFHVQDRPVSTVVINRYEFWDDISDKPISTSLMKSTVPIQRLVIDTKPLIPPRVLPRLWSDIADLRDLRFLSLSHAFDKNVAARRDQIFDIISTFRHLEEVEWTGGTETTVRAEILSLAALRCPSVKIHIRLSEYHDEYVPIPFQEEEGYDDEFLPLM